MTNPLSVPATNVRRGLLFSLIGIPVSVAIFAIVGLVLGPLVSLIAVAVPLVLGAFYIRGAGGQPAVGARVPFVVITLVAMVIGTAVGLVAGFFNTFSAVGGDGGIFGSAFQTTVRSQFTNNTLEIVLPVAFGLGIGVFTLIKFLRGDAAMRLGGGRPAPSRAPGEVDAALQALTLPPLAPPPSATASPVANQSSPGILLNGQPLDPEKPMKPGKK